MSWEHNKRHVFGVRKVRWDKFWHVLYRTGVIDTDYGRETYDHVTRKTALRVLRMIPKWSYGVLLFLLVGCRTPRCYTGPASCDLKPAAIVRYASGVMADDVEYVDAR